MLQRTKGMEQLVLSNVHKMFFKQMNLSVPLTPCEQSDMEVVQLTTLFPSLHIEMQNLIALYVWAALQ